ncbi:MAG: hypothetical protein ACR2F1_12120 [Nitrososphaeraceae archaeon]
MSFISDVNGESSKKTDDGYLIINDPKLKAELVISGLEFPTITNQVMIS